MPEIKQDIRAATFVVAANNSLHKNMADYACDGVADQVEIQAAIDAAAIDRGGGGYPTSGGLVVLSEGTFFISAPIIMKNAVSLVGAGWVTNLNLVANCNMFEADPAADASRIVIQDMCMVGGSGAFSGNCFHIPAGRLHGDWYYVRLLITHFTGNGIYIESGWQHHIIDSIIEQMRGNGTACFYAKPTGWAAAQNVRRIFISGSNLLARADVEAVAVNAIRWEGEADTTAEATELYYLSVRACNLCSRGAPTVYLRSLKKFNIEGCPDIEERIGGGGYDGIFITDDGVTASRKGYIGGNLFGNRYSLRYGVSVWGLSAQIAIGVNQYNLITGRKVYFDTGVVNTDVTAPTYDPFGILRIGQYALTYPGLYSGAGTPIAPNTLYCVPFPVPRTMTFDKIAIRVTAGAVGNVRMGILADNGLCYPGDVVKDFGTVDVSAPGVKTIAQDLQLTKGLYWRCFVSNGAPSIARDYMHFKPLGLADAMNQDQDTWEGAFAYGVLTNDPAGLAITARSGYPWGIHLRLASLD